MNSVAPSMRCSTVTPWSAAPTDSVAPRPGHIAWQSSGEESLTHWLASLDQWQRLRESPAARVVKSGRHRTVYLIDHPTGGYFLKHYTAGDWYTRLKSSLRGPVAYLEWANLLRARELGIATVEPVAVGRSIDTGGQTQAFLVTRAIEAAIPLDDLVREQRFDRWPGSPVQLRQSLAVSLGQLAGQIHRAGLYHRDLHAGNLLVSMGPEGRAELRLVDLHPVLWVEQLSARQIEHNLASLHHFLLQFSSPSDRLRCFRAYWQTTGTGTGDGSTAAHTAILSPADGFPATYRRLTQACRSEAEQTWRRRDRKWERGGRRVVLRHSESLRYRGLNRLSAVVHETLFRDPDALFADGVVRWFKRSDRRRSAIVRLPQSGEADQLYHCKSRTRTTASEWLRSWTGHSDCRRGWEIGHAFLRRGIPTPLPVACIESRDEGNVRQYLITEAIPHAVGLSAYFQWMLAEMPPPARNEWLRSATFRLAGTLRQMHESGFDHRDLKANNILVDIVDGRPRLSLIDLESVRRWDTMPVFARVRNLARLQVSSELCGVLTPAQRLRFLKRYLPASEFPAWKRWWRAVARRAGSIRQRNARRGRPRPT